jgi:hypothetical protein
MKITILSVTSLLATLSCLCQANELSLDSKRLERIDDIVKTAISDGTFPGGNLLVSQGDKIVKQQSYGTMDSKSQPVDEDTLLYSGCFQ